MSSLLRRLPLSRLLALCAATVAFGAGGAAIASAVDTGPVPKATSLAQGDPRRAREPERSKA